MYARMRPVRPSASWTVAMPRWANGANRSIAERSTFRTTMPLITCRTFHAVRRPSSGGPDVLRVVVDVGMAGRCEQFRLFRLEIEQPLNAAHDGVVDFALAVEADQRRSLGVEQGRLELAQARPDACGFAVLLRAVHTELRLATAEPAAQHLADFLRNVAAAGQLVEPLQRRLRGGGERDAFLALVGPVVDDLQPAQEERQRSPLADQRREQHAEGEEDDEVA